MNAIILTRGQDAAAQELKCINYARLKGYKVIAVIENIKDLDDFQDQVDVIVVSNVSRVSRSYQKYLLICEMLEEFNVTIEVAE